MIQYEKDGVTLVDGAGNASTPMDGAKYSAMLSVRDAQIAAANANTQAVASYNTALANAQISVNAARPATAPPKPLQTVVDDSGVTTYVPFSPPLADLVPLAITAPSTGTIPVAVTVDTQAIMYAMITAIYRKMFPST
jgi:PAB1-binding protein PBP1